MREKPFLKLLQAYILDAIDALPSSNRETLEAMEPKLREIFDSRGNWIDIIEEQMDFDKEFPIQIRSIWEKNRKLASDKGEELIPLDFVDLFIHHNFPYALTR